MGNKDDEVNCTLNQSEFDNNIEKNIKKRIEIKEKRKQDKLKKKEEEVRKKESKLVDNTKDLAGCVYGIKGTTKE